MRAIVLGSAAGGGFPQWNCGCPNCVAVREGRPGYLPRTQDSLALSAGAESGRFVLVNASPEILTQIQRTPALWPRGPRHSPIAAIVLTNGDMDHVLGLFSLRESWPLALYITASVRRGLEESAFIRTLRRFDGQLQIRELELGRRRVELADAAGEPLDLAVVASPMAGKLPVHFVGHAQASSEDNVALTFNDRAGRSLLYAAAGASAEASLDGCDAVLFDGTFYREDELVALGLSKSYARDMAHVPIDGPQGSLARLSGAPARRIYTHINNTNPILAPDSAERRRVEEAGWEIAYDGMEILL